MSKLVLIFCLSTFAATAADLYNFSLLPADGTAQGAPGETVGWGYSLQNQSNTLWLVPTDLNPGTFQNATPSLLFDFPVVAPSTGLAEEFEASSSTGLYQLTWDPSAPLGFVNAGSFDLGAQWWSGDPLAGGQFVADAPGASAFYTATVSASTVPEPGSFALVGAGLCMAAIFGKLHRCNTRGGC